MIRNIAAHAYILEAPSGKMRDDYLVKAVASVLCKNKDADEEPCEVCTSCRCVRAGTHEDVFYMRRTGKEKYRVDDATAFTERAAMSPYGTHNIGIIEDAELMSEVVQNKLLKTIEEPGEGTIIIMTTSNAAALLDTVRSRCVHLRIPFDYDLYEKELSLNSHAENTEDNPCGDPYDKLHEAATGIMNKGIGFNEFRKIVAGFSSSDEACAMLDLLEHRMNEAVRSGNMKCEEMRLLCDDIDRIETARRDIFAGMGYKNALKRLFLELLSN